MKARSFLVTLAPLLAAASAIHAESTINNTDKYAYGANIGWINCRDAGSTSQGAVIGEYVCSGYLYAANCGWIDLGDGSPANGIHYGNASASDFGVNVSDHSSVGSNHSAQLRGYAYGANIGWINFTEVPGDPDSNPRIDLTTGKLLGYAYGANVGWIHLGSTTTTLVRTDSIAPGASADGDTIADAFERIHTDPDNLDVMNDSTDNDGDGVLDKDEEIAGTDPFDADEWLRFTEIVTGNAPSTHGLTWRSTPARVYLITTSDDLGPLSWTDAGLGIVVPTSGTTTTRTVVDHGADRSFWRVEARKPLAP